MSRVLLLAADKPLPLKDCRELRTKEVRVNGTTYAVSMEMGFNVEPHSYYRDAVDGLGYEMKPYQYELSVEADETDLQNLRAYLKENLSPGESVELWNLWVDMDQPRYLPHYRGALAEFDLDTLEQFCSPPGKNGLPDQCRMTVTI